MKTVFKNPGWVYLIGYQNAGDNAPVKVGYARSPASRLASLQTASPRPLKILDRFPGDFASERAMHRALKRYHCHLEREWFTHSTVIDDAFDTIREALLDGAEARLGADWSPTQDRGMDEWYVATPASERLIAKAVQHAFMVQDYIRATGDEYLADAPPELAEFHA